MKYMSGNEDRRMDRRMDRRTDGTGHNTLWPIHGKKMAYHDRYLFVIFDNPILTYVSFCLVLSIPTVLSRE